MVYDLLTHNHVGKKFRLLWFHLPQHAHTSVKETPQVQESIPIDHFYALEAHKHLQVAV